MLQLLVTANKLNKRNQIPSTLPDNIGISGTVMKGYSFEGYEVGKVPNPGLGKWYKDKEGSFYWGGGLIVESIKTDINLPGLPVNLPDDFRLGVDVAHHDEKPDWDAFKASGASFVYIKTSEGVGTPDPMAKLHADNARQHDLRIGYYHFCRPDTRNGGTVINDALAEADEALRIISGIQKPDLPLVLDLEDQATWDTPLGPSDYALWVSSFINRIKEKSGTDSIIYSRTEYLNRKLDSNHGLDAISKLWLSYYPKNGDCNHVPCPAGWDDWALWQYTESGVIGKSTAMDINIMKDDSLFNNIAWQG